MNNTKEREKLNLADTSKLQLKSLLDFAEALGYAHYDDYSKFSYIRLCFEDDYNKKAENAWATVSFETMCTWYNNNFQSPQKYCNPFARRTIYGLPFTSRECVRAISAKLVSQVKLQYSKKERKVITQDYQVEFVKGDFNETRV